MSEHHIVPVKIYLVIFGALMVLTALTVAVASFDLGPMNAVVMLTIALVKAFLVILFFMHVKYSDTLTKLVIAGGFIWFLILIAITLSDYLSRSWLDFAGK
ncbi:MAG: cytochrome C oxidase subunit IV family protein [Acidobacteriota bacterium]